VTVVVGGTGLVAGVGAGTAYLPKLAPGAASPAALHQPMNSDPLLTFTVPPGLAPGTELHVVASIPAGFEATGSPSLATTLTLITH
jgi:hypothetical protein